MPAPDKLNAEDFYGKVFTSIVSTSKGRKKRLQIANYLYENKTETIFQVVHSLGLVKERITGYSSLEEAIYIYNIAAS